jgi:xanthine dehydrogenase accessory factor
MGVPDHVIARIRGPIGLVDRAKDPGTLALSVLSEIAATRMAADAA